MGNNLWLTYAWVDNADYDVDHVIIKLRESGLSVHFDRQQIIPGRRLWSQVDKAISDPDRCDGWAIFATENSFKSEPCLEELAYALDRTLRTRGTEFPLIGIFPQPIDRKIIPSAIATRLYVTLRDPDWATAVRDALHGTRTEPKLVFDPIVAKFHKGDILELRPRSGRFYPCLVLVPTHEKDLLDTVDYGPSDRPPMASIVSSSAVDTDEWFGVQLGHAIDNLSSAYVHFKGGLPSRVIFGDNKDQYTIFPARVPR